jgi:hypothetical protein
LMGFWFGLTSQQRRTPLRLKLEGRNSFVAERVSLVSIVRQYLTFVGGYWIYQLYMAERHLTAWLLRGATSPSGLLHDDLVLFGDNAYLNSKYMVTLYPNVLSGGKDDYNFYH